MDTQTTTPESFTVHSDRAPIDWAAIALFIILTFGLSWVIWLGLAAVGVPFTIRVAIGMFGPAIAATVVRLIRRDGFADAGLRLAARGRKGVVRIYIAAYVLPPLLIAVGICLALLTTVQHWAFSENLHALEHVIVVQMQNTGQSLPSSLTSERLALISLLAQTAIAFTLGIAFNMIFTFGEEFGWRGYLLPRLSALGGVQAAILLGMIFAWLRFRSGSVWPSTLAHAAFNAQAGFAIVFLSQADSLLRAPIGLIGLLPTIAFAIWLAITGRLKADINQSSETQRIA